MSRLQARTARTSRLALACRSPASFLISKVTDGFFLSWTENHWRRCGLCRLVRAQSGLSGVSCCTSSVGAAEAQVLLWWFLSNTQIEHTWMALQLRLLSETHDSITRSQTLLTTSPVTPSVHFIMSGNSLLMFGKSHLVPIGIFFKMRKPILFI